MNRHEDRSLSLARTQVEITHLPFDTPWHRTESALRQPFIQYLGKDLFMKFLPVPRGEKRQTRSFFDGQPERRGEKKAGRDLHQPIAPLHA